MDGTVYCPARGVCGHGGIKINEMAEENLARFVLYLNFQLAPAPRQETDVVCPRESRPTVTGSQRGVRRTTTRPTFVPRSCHEQLQIAPGCVFPSAASMSLPLSSVNSADHGGVCCSPRTGAVGASDRQAPCAEEPSQARPIYAVFRKLSPPTHTSAVIANNARCPWGLYFLFLSPYCKFAFSL